MKEIVLDTETTGISVKEGHRIVEIGCIELDNLIPTKNKFHFYINPERKVSEKAFEVHGYSDEFLSKQKRFNEIVDEFLEFINGKRLIIHNADFDLGHLNNELLLSGKNKISNEIIDTLELARDKFPGASISLDALCKRYRIDNSKRITHTALIDCDLLAKVYINLIDQKEPSFDLLDKNEFFDIKNSPINKKNISYSKKVVKPTIEELKRHKEYISKNLKKNFY
tara:strand:- start:436 stop:1110 length:675 start_codon:yes stop_codon:yes gene_type:complete